MDALVGLLGALMGAYLTAKYAERNERRSQLRALADFLEGIAGCLERMEKSLRNDVVPTADGHRLEEIARPARQTGRSAGKTAHVDEVRPYIRQSRAGLLPALRRGREAMHEHHVPAAALRGRKHQGAFPLSGLLLQPS